MIKVPFRNRFRHKVNKKPLKCFFILKTKKYFIKTYNFSEILVSKKNNDLFLMQVDFKDKSFLSNKNKFVPRELILSKMTIYRFRRAFFFHIRIISFVVSKTEIERSTKKKLPNNCGKSSIISIKEKFAKVLLKKFFIPQKKVKIFFHEGFILLMYLILRRLPISKKITVINLKKKFLRMDFFRINPESIQIFFSNSSFLENFTRNIDLVTSKNRNFILHVLGTCNFLEIFIFRFLKYQKNIVGFENYDSLIFLKLLAAKTILLDYIHNKFLYFLWNFKKIYTLAPFFFGILNKISIHHFLFHRAFFFKKEINPFSIFQKGNLFKFFEKFFLAISLSFFINLKNERNYRWFSKIFLSEILYFDLLGWVIKNNSNGCLVFLKFKFLAASFNKTLLNIEFLGKFFSLANSLVKNYNKFASFVFLLKIFQKISILFFNEDKKTCSVNKHFFSFNVISKWNTFKTLMNLYFSIKYEKISLSELNNFLGCIVYFLENSLIKILPKNNNYRDFSFKKISRRKIKKVVEKISFWLTEKYQKSSPTMKKESSVENSFFIFFTILRNIQDNPKNQNSAFYEKLFLSWIFFLIRKTILVGTCQMTLGLPCLSWAKNDNLTWLLFVRNLLLRAFKLYFKKNKFLTSQQKREQINFLLCSKLSLPKKYFFLNKYVSNLGIYKSKKQELSRNKFFLIFTPIILSQGFCIELDQFWMFRNKSITTNLLFERSKCFFFFKLQCNFHILYNSIFEIIYFFFHLFEIIILQRKTNKCVDEFFFSPYVNRSMRKMIKIVENRKSFFYSKKNFKSKKEVRSFLLNIIQITVSLLKKYAPLGSYVLCRPFLNHYENDDIVKYREAIPHRKKGGARKTVFSFKKKFSFLFFHSAILN